MWVITQERSAALDNQSSKEKLQELQLQAQVDKDNAELDEGVKEEADNNKEITDHNFTVKQKLLLEFKEEILQCQSCQQTNQTLVLTKCSPRVVDILRNEANLVQKVKTEYQLHLVDTESQQELFRFKLESS